MKKRRRESETYHGFNYNPEMMDMQLERHSVNWNDSIFTLIMYPKIGNNVTTCF